MRLLTLTLLKLGVFLVDHVKTALAAHDFAFDAAFFDGGSNFHL
jgi:hypothetical protein